MNGDSARKFGCGLAILLSLTCAANAALGQEAKLDFRGKKDHEDFIRPAGKIDEKYLSYEDEGLRIHFKSGEGPTSQNQVGISWRFPVRGDFTTSVHYEIIQINPPTLGGAIGLELYLMLDNDARDGIPLSRLITGKDSRLSIQVRTNDEKGNRISKGYKKIAPPENPRGRLKLAREKGILIASYTEGDDENFKELNRIEIGEFDLRMVRIAIVVGGDPKAQADVRLLECSLKGDVPGMAAGPAAPGAPKDGVAPPPPAASQTGSRFLFWILLFVGATTFVVFGIVFLIVWRSKRAQATGPATPSEPHHDSTDEDDIETMEASISPSMRGFACETCGKKLKAQETASGKRVKCPGCGNAVLVP